MEALTRFPESLPQETIDFFKDMGDGVPETSEYLEALLTCGHYTEPLYVRSSTWDFPHDPHACPTCGEVRQFDLRLQTLLNEEDL